jgi:hypothetical protein
MKIELEVTTQEYRAVHDLLAYVLRPRALQDDPDTRPLRSFLGKWKQMRGDAMCSGCDRSIIYAKGLCRRCYMRERRRKMVDVA